ncbi:DUF397 domain-containing protein [Streptomyces triticirhizae]|uniref:DUF397 domain-containing protein n=1 Tax=Streptomyces triticirhizae TaxID=2483353 RepID=A0A3M2M1V6_9ACTN|nr:DUF397 domain-containing protein [Streptomyces triticirhizae]RMI43601.1 DUF397 domain-containing protein [Streptomyces triticirhizae]
MADNGWRKSTYSDNQGGACLEVRDDTPGIVPVRDSKVQNGDTLTIGADAWTSFLHHIKH